MATSQQTSVSSKDAPTNPRGIPYAPFVDRVEDYVASRAEVEGALKNFQEMISCVSPVLALMVCFADGVRNSKYQFMQANTERRALGLKDKIPDIQKTLETVEFLQRRTVGSRFS